MSDQDQSQPSSDQTLNQDQNLDQTIFQSASESFQSESAPVSSTESPEPPTPAQPDAPVVTTPVSAPVASAPKVKVTETTKVTTPVVEKPDWPEVTGIADVDRALKNVPAAHQVGIQRLMEYTQKMNPRRAIDVEEGARTQAALYKVIQNTINRETQYFRPVFTAILAMFTQEKSGVFQEANVFRFMDNVPLPETDRKAFVRLLNLIKVAGPKEGRAVALKQVDFQQSLRYGLTEEGRQRVLDFFNVGK